ncbi:MAG TPA: YidB family protein [Xanthobacteraceae bacterium]|nr:YidB family protein [Xanthobacteraceae bacterium]
MGLMDVLRGMQHGPHGQPPPPPPGGGNAGTGMSPITMAILGLLAYKAVKSFGGGQAGAPSSAGQAPSPQTGDKINVTAPEESGGGLSDLLKGGLGGLLAGGTAGSVLSGGLNDLLKQFQQSGLHEEANSWIGSGPNKTIAPGDLANALGADQINSLMEHSGLSRDELLEGLSQHLPRVVDQLTPDGKVPRKISM